MTATEAVSESPHKRRVLVVDDDKIVLEMLELFLKVEGYEVMTANSGLKIVSLLQSERPDLILLDIMMPWVDGYALCKAIKESEELRSIPVVFVSARGGEEAVRKGYEAGCDAFFPKPLDIKDFGVQIRRLLDKSN